MGDNIPKPPTLPDIPIQSATSDDGQSRVQQGQATNSLLSQVSGFNKSSLKKTDTNIKTEDGKLIKETRDQWGNYKREVTNKGDYGFIPDMHLDLQVGEIHDNLFIASQDVAADGDILYKHGVTHILNLGTYVKNYFPDKIQYLRIEINDTEDSNAVKEFDNAFKFIDEGRSKGAVLIHCNAGVSRASTFMIGYLMSREKMPLDEAFDFVKSKRSKISPNDGFLKQLRRYNEELGFGKCKI